MFFADLGKKAMDPQYVKQVAQKIAKIDDPLPPGFNYQMGLDLMGMSIVSITNPDARFNLMLMKLPQSASAENPDNIIEKYAESGVPTVGAGRQQGATSQPMEIKSKGKTTVGGEEMPYAIGETQGEKNEKMQQLLGVIVPKGGKETVVVIGQSADGNYNMQLTEKLFSAIKGF
ncbi:MAG TPA: hypothetical protein V6D17_05960 [Candidatus Obscuribacterales bacterium]